MTVTRALVTGASGFIGSHLVGLLRRRGDDVCCLVRRTSQVSRLQRMGVSLVAGDVRDRGSLETAVAGVDVVYHLAGLTRGRSVSQLLAVNAAGVENVARTCAARSKVPVLVVVSTLAAAGPSPAARPRTERDRPAPVSNYGRSKLAGEQAAARWAGDVPTTIVRPPVVLGAGDKDGRLLFRMIARRGLHLVPAMGTARVSVIHVDDLVAALGLAASTGDRIPGRRHAADTPDRGVYFVAAEVHPTYAELGRLVGQAVGRCRVRVLHAPRAAVWMAGLVGEMTSHVRRKPSLLCLDKYREVTAGSWTCAADRIRTGLGFAPARPLADRLRQTADWYRREGWL